MEFGKNNSPKTVAETEQQPDEEAAEKAAEEARAVKVTSPNGLNVREEPDAEASIVRVLAYGDNAAIEYETDGWGKTHDGYIRLEFTEPVAG